MRQTDNLNLNLLDRSDNMTWEEGVNKNFESIDDAAGYIDSERRRIQRLGGDILFGPPGTDPSTVDVVVSSVASIQNAVDEWQKSNKDLVGEFRSVQLSYDGGPTTFRATINVPSNAGFLDRVEPHIRTYYSVGDLVYSDTDTLLGYIISNDRGYICLDRRVTNGTYNLKVYRARPLTLRFLPGVYDICTRTTDSTIRYWSPGTAYIPGSWLSYPASGLTSVYSSATSVSASTTPLDRLPEASAAKLRLYGDISIYGYNAIIKALGTNSAQYVQQSVIQLIGSNNQIIEGLTIIDGSLRSSGTAYHTNRPALFISSCYNTLIQNIRLEAGFYLSDVAHFNRLSNCTIRDIQYRGEGGTGGSKSSVYFTNCTGSCIDKLQSVSRSWYDQPYLYFRGCNRLTVSDINDSGHAGEQYVRIQYSSDIVLDTSTWVYRIEVTSSSNIDLRGSTNSCSVSKCIGIYLVSLAYNALSITNSTYVTNASVNSALIRYTYRPVVITAVEDVSTDTDTKFYIYMADSVVSGWPGYSTRLEDVVNGALQSIGTSSSDPVRYLTSDSSDPTYCIYRMTLTSDPGDIVGSTLFLS